MKFKLKLLHITQIENDIYYCRYYMYVIVIHKIPSFKSYIHSFACKHIHTFYMHITHLLLRYTQPFRGVHLRIPNHGKVAKLLLTECRRVTTIFLHASKYHTAFATNVYSQVSLKRVRLHPSESIFTQASPFPPEWIHLASLQKSTMRRGGINTSKLQEKCPSPAHTPKNSKTSTVRQQPFFPWGSPTLYTIHSLSKYLFSFSQHLNPSVRRT